MKTKFDSVTTKLLVVVTIVVAGCAAPTRPPNAQTEYTYGYEVDGVTKTELWKRARDHFAGAYGDSRVVFRVMDEEDGTIIGKGTASWKHITSMNFSFTCLTDYHIRFAAKDNRARLQFEIIEDAPDYSDCKNWQVTSQQGYEELQTKLDQYSEDLHNALLGKGAATQLKNF